MEQVLQTLQNLYKNKSITSFSRVRSLAWWSACLIWQRSACLLKQAGGPEKKDSNIYCLRRNSNLSGPIFFSKNSTNQSFNILQIRDKIFQELSSVHSIHHAMIENR